MNDLDNKIKLVEEKIDEIKRKHEKEKKLKILTNELKSLEYPEKHPFRYKIKLISNKIRKEIYNRNKRTKLESEEEKLENLI